MATTIITKFGSGAPAASDVVRGELAVDTENKRLYTEDSGGSVVELGTNPAANVTFGDNVKAVFGAGSDLQIYHTGTYSLIADTSGTGPLRVVTNTFQLNNAADTENMINAAEGGAVTLYNAGNAKLATTSTGVDVTGTVTATAALEVESGVPYIDWTDTATTDEDTRAITYNGDFYIGTIDDAKSTTKKRFLIDHSTGDISFYEDTGTTAKLFWDASAESLGIGTSSPSNPLTVLGSAGTIASFTNGADADLLIKAESAVTTLTPTTGTLAFGTSSTERMRIASDGSISTPTAGTSNLRLGSGAGASIASGGNYNVVLGDEAGTAVTSGDKNTLVGAFAGDALTDADENVAVGMSALGGDTLGSKSTAIGQGALQVQNFTSATDTHNTAVGYSAGNRVTTGVENTFMGGLAGDAITTSSGNVAIGYQALTTEDTTGKATAVGWKTLAQQNASSDSYNVAVGYNAGFSVSTGTNNTLIGGLAGDAVTTGINNTALGGGALSGLTANSNSTAVGFYASLYNTGGANTAVGSLALQGVSGSNGTNNVAMGYAALYDLTTGHSNTAIGFLAGEDVNSGIQNTFLGTEAGKKITTGNSNTALGYGTMYNGSTGSNNVAVGVVSMHNAAVTGGINTAVGYATLYSLTSGSNNLALGRDAGRTGAPGGQITTSSNNVLIGDSNITAAHIQVDWTIASDERDKTDFAALDLGLDFVKALEPLTYKWDKRSKYGDKNAEDYDLNAQTPDGTHKEDWLDIGFKAQAVEALEIAAGYTKETNTNLVSSHSGDGKQMGLQYSKFVPILVKAIQEQQVLIDSLTARIETLEG